MYDIIASQYFYTVGNCAVEDGGDRAFQEYIETTFFGGFSYSEIESCFAANYVELNVIAEKLTCEFNGGYQALKGIKITVEKLNTNRLACVFSGSNLRAEYNFSKKDDCSEVILGEYAIRDLKDRYFWEVSRGDFEKIKKLVAMHEETGHIKNFYIYPDGVVKLGEKSDMGYIKRNFYDIEKGYNDFHNNCSIVKIEL